MRAGFLAVLSLVLLSSVAWAQADPESRVNAQRDELARIRAERDELEKKMSGLQNTAHELRDEVNLLDKQHDATARMVQSLDQQLVAHRLGRADAGKPAGGHPQHHVSADAGDLGSERGG